MKSKRLESGFQLRSKSLMRKLKNRNIIPQNVDLTRDKIAKAESVAVGKNIKLPLSPLTCSGTSFQCSVAGSGKTPIKNVRMNPENYDFLATPMKDAEMTNTNFQPDFILNWQNNSIETEYTKHSLKATYGFENFQ